MKKINITTGGWPIHAGFLKNMQEGLVEAIKGATSNMPNCILSGAALQHVGGTNYNCSEGFIKWNGEIYHVPAHALTIAGGQYAVAYLVVTNTLVPLIYKDGSQPNMAINTEVKFKGAAAAGVGEALMSSFSMEFYERSAWADVDPYSIVLSTVIPTFTNGWVTGASFASEASTAGYNARVRRIGNFLHFDGYAKFDGPMDSGDYVIMTLPAILRPVNRKIVPVVVTDYVGYNIGHLIFMPNGNVELVSSLAEDITASLCDIKIPLG